MGANAQTSVPTFVSGQVLTAAQQNQINTGVPVAAGTAERDGLFGGSGEKTLAEGQLVYVESLDVVQYYDGSSWATLGPAGLQLISTTTIGTTVASVTVTGAFSATYDNYLITVTGGVASGTQNVAMTLGATSAGYYMGGAKFNYATAATTALNTNNGSSFARALTVTANTLDNAIYVFSPNLAKRTSIVCMSGTTDTGEGFYMHGGFLDDATQYTAFTLTPSGTLTGGEICVYGLKN